MQQLCHNSGGMVTVYLGTTRTQLCLINAYSDKLLHTHTVKCLCSTGTKYSILDVF